jgi:hypothetical protein
MVGRRGGKKGREGVAADARSRVRSLSFIERVEQLRVETRTDATTRAFYPSDYIIRHESTLLLLEPTGEGDGRWVPLAKLLWDRIAIHAAVGQEDLFEVFEVDEEGEYGALYRAFFDSDTGYWKDRFAEDFLDSLVYVRGFAAAPSGVDEQEVAEEILEHVLGLLAGNALAAALQDQRHSPSFVAALRARGFRRVAGRRDASVLAVSLARKRPPLPMGESWGVRVEDLAGPSARPAPILQTDDFAIFAVLRFDRDGNLEPVTRGEFLRFSDRKATLPLTRPGFVDLVFVLARPDPSLAPPFHSRGASTVAEVPVTEAGVIVDPPGVLGAGQRQLTDDETARFDRMVDDPAVMSFLFEGFAAVFGGGEGSEGAH